MYFVFSSKLKPSRTTTAFLPLVCFSRGLWESVCDFTSCSAFSTFFLDILFTCCCLNLLVCAHMYKCHGHFMFVCICVYGAGGMNPNEIFYGPVDLLIVPQVLSLLTPNLSETTCWAWFFSPSLLLLLLCISSFLSSLPLFSR